MRRNTVVGFVATIVGAFAVGVIGIPRNGITGKRYRGTKVRRIIIEQRRNSGARVNANFSNLPNASDPGGCGGHTMRAAGRQKTRCLTQR